MTLERGDRAGGHLGIQVVRVTLDPRAALIAVVARAAGGHQVQAREFLVRGVQVVQHLGAELAHLAAGDDAHLHVVQQGTQRDVHAGGQRRLRGRQGVIEIKGNELHDATLLLRSLRIFDSALRGLGLLVGGHREDLQQNDRGDEAAPDEQDRQDHQSDSGSGHLAPPSFEALSSASSARI